jgi:hypothetical protein
MQWKTDPLDMDFVLLLQLVNTPGNEVAPRSDIVGKDLQDHLFSHSSLQYCSKPLARSRFDRLRALRDLCELCENYQSSAFDLQCLGENCKRK